ncbi:MAG TPA: ATP-binding protein [Polyangiaceae bacterium]|nr:ATP-binding protein [Polyangiaceae bacterium]
MSPMEVVQHRPPSATVLGPHGLSAALIRSADGRRLWRDPGFCLLEAQLEQGRGLSRLFENVALPADGELRLARGARVRWRMLLLPWPAEGQVQLWTFDDISADVLTRQALEEAQGKLRLLSAHTKGILFEFDDQARFVRVWASDPKLLLRPESELLGRTLLEALGPDAGRWHHERVCHTLRTGEDQDYEYTVDVPSGGSNFACTSVALPSPDGVGRGAVFWIRDVTEEVQLRSKLQRADRLAAVGTLAAGVAHEVNNPLGYMRLNLEHVLRELSALSSDPELSSRVTPLIRPLEMVREGAERVHTIVSALLNLTRATDTHQTVDLRVVLDRCLEVTARHFEGRALVQRDYGTVPEVTANETRLVQVFSNLITNAAEAMPRGTRAHTLYVSTSTGSRGEAVVEIRDTGSGIPREYLQRVFDPFFTTKETGLGLGLAICQRIISSFGGEIDVESRPGEGATFRVSLPPASGVREAVHRLNGKMP